MASCPELPQPADDKHADGAHRHKNDRDRPIVVALALVASPCPGRYRPGRISPMMPHWRADQIGATQARKFHGGRLLIGALIPGQNGVEILPGLSPLIESIQWRRIGCGTGGTGGMEANDMCRTGHGASDSTSNEIRTPGARVIISWPRHGITCAFSVTPGFIPRPGSGSGVLNGTYRRQATDA